MALKQISVFVENKAGKLSEFTRVLWERNVGLKAFSLADTRDFGVLRIIVDDPVQTSAILQEEGYAFSITKVVAVAIQDSPGSLHRIITILGNEGINIEYSYAFTQKGRGLSYMILRVEDDERAERVLAEHHVDLIDLMALETCD